MLVELPTYSHQYMGMYRISPGAIMASSPRASLNSGNRSKSGSSNSTCRENNNSKKKNKNNDNDNANDNENNNNNNSSYMHLAEPQCFWEIFDNSCLASTVNLSPADNIFPLSRWFAKRKKHH